MPNASCRIEIRALGVHSQLFRFALDNTFYGGRLNARSKNNRARTSRQTTGEISVDAGGRVRARRDTSRSQRKAWRPVDEAGDRHWIVEGSASWRKTPRERHVRQNADAGQTRHRKRSEIATQSLHHPLARGARGASPRRSYRRVISFARQAGAGQRSETVGITAFRRGAEGGPDERSSGPQGRCAKGCAHARGTTSSLTATRPVVRSRCS
jgi:hypothetical protein